MEHKATYKTLSTRRTLFRAVDMIQEAFFIFRKHGFEYKTQGIRNEGFTTWIFKKPTSASHIGTEFDDSKLPNLQDRSAVMTALYCNDGIAYTSELVNVALRGIATSIEEVQYKLFNHRRQIVYFGVSDETAPTDWPHDVFKVVLKSGEQYIIDFTGHQYGFDESILPEADYLASRVQKTLKSRPLGHHRSNSLVDVMRFVPSCNNALAYILDCYYALEMEKAVAEWERQPKRGLNEILAFPEAPYSDERTKFLEHLRRSLVGGRTKLVKQGLVRYTSDGSTIATDQSSKLKAEISHCQVTVI
ncbi:MAG: hypothetical protein M1822_008316 [Bathelium mastoideum]|nr:MAG: hypothetical protein M1822_008316 [Bathelium mastoideum]